MIRGEGHLPKTRFLMHSTWKMCLQPSMIEGSSPRPEIMQMPQYLVEEHEVAGLPDLVLVTEPRRPAVMTLAERVVEERGMLPPRKGR